MRKRRLALAALTTLGMVGAGLLGGLSASAAPVAPELTIPSTIDSGQQLRISGSECRQVLGFPQPTVLVSVDGVVSTTYPDADGNWFAITPAMEPGAVAVTASCEDYSGSYPYAPASVDVVDRATLSVSPDTVPTGGSFTLTGEGWFFACDCLNDPIDVTITDGTTSWPLGSSWDPSTGERNPAWTVNPGWIPEGSGYDFGDMVATLPVPAELAPGVYEVVSVQSGFHQKSVELIVTDETPAVATVALSKGSVRAGEKLDVTGTGFIPGEEVRVELHSTPVTLTSVTASGAGEISARVTIPAATALGAHEIVLIGVDSGRSASADLAVTAAVAPPGTGAGSGSGSLAATGGAVPIALTGVAALLLLLGAAGMFARRRVVRS